MNKAVDFEAFLKMTLILNINLLECLGNHNTAFGFKIWESKHLCYVLYNFFKDINTCNTQLIILQQSKLTKKKCILHCLICVLGNNINSKLSDIFIVWTVEYLIKCGDSEQCKKKSKGKYETCAEEARTLQKLEVGSGTCTMEE